LRTWLDLLKLQPAAGHRHDRPHTVGNVKVEFSPTDVLYIAIIEWF